MDSGNLLTNAYQRRLLKRWKPILESGKTIESTSTKVALAQLLENTRNFYKMRGMLNEAGVAQANVVGSTGRFQIRPVSDLRNSFVPTYYLCFLS